MSGPIRNAVGRYRLDRMQTFDPISADSAVAAHPKAADLLAAWNRWRGSRALPERRDIDPMDIPTLLPNLVLLDVEDRDFRFRLVGETIATRYASRLKGKSIGELMSGSNLDETLYEHRRCAEERRAVLVTQSTDKTSLGDIHAYYRLSLPVGNHGPQASHIISVMDFYR